MSFCSQLLSPQPSIPCQNAMESWPCAPMKQRGGEGEKGWDRMERKEFDYFLNKFENAIFHPVLPAALWLMTADMLMKHDSSVASVTASKALHCPGQMRCLDEVLVRYLGRRGKLSSQLPGQGAAGSGA